MTRILDADETAAHVEGLVHLDTQRAGPGLDLTVGAVARVAGAGRLDFGGSEFELAQREELEPELARPDDDYGWWDLEPGSYAIRYNETPALDESLTGLVFPLERLLRAGAGHPSFVVERSTDRLEALLTVGSGGCHLKENCRISRLVVTASG